MANATGRPIAPLVLSLDERAYLERQVRRHRAARSLSERCRVILRCADGVPSKSVASELGVHEHTVGKWRARFLTDRIDGLLDESRVYMIAARSPPRSEPANSQALRPSAIPRNSRSAPQKAHGKLPVVAPLALEAVKKIDAIFDIEREINGRSVEERLVVRRSCSVPLVARLADWMRSERARLSRHAEAAKAMDYMLKRWAAFTRFLDDGRICLTNNAAERELRGIALGRKAWLFAGSDRGGERAAIMYTLIQTARLNRVDPQAWLADVLSCINDYNIQNLGDFVPWNWRTRSDKLA